MNYKFAGMEFIRTKYSAMNGLTTVAFTENSTENTPFMLMATPKGISCKGAMSKEISTGPQLQSFAKMVSDIWSEHERLAPKIEVPASGLIRG